MDLYSNNLSRAGWMLGAVALGAIAMYVFDPAQGKRRRALAKDKTYSAYVKTCKSVEKKARDLSNRAHGAIAEARQWLPEKENLPSAHGATPEP